VRANIVERPTTGQSIPVFSAILRKLAKSYAGNRKLFERKLFRPLMVKLNGLGGYVLLDALDTGTVEKLIGEIIAKDFKLLEKDI
jgi:Holliday junction resolvasome RuvABC DNA-binding subunit